MTKMSDDLGIYPFQDGDGKDRLFLARFEFPNYGEEFQFSKALTVKDASGDDIQVDPKPLGFIDFLAGFPIDCVEMLVFIGEFSSKAKEGEDSKVAVQAGEGATAPVWDGDSKIFEWPEKDKILLNLTALATTNVSVIMAPNLEGEPNPTQAHWWFRVFLSAGTDEAPKKFPVPGEFVGLGVRMMPGEYWGKQKSSPFLYSGNWFDSVYLTGSRITEVINPTDEIPYPTYKVAWRATDKNKDGIVTANPSDFAEYKVGDRVTILKDVATTKTSQLWKDSDQKYWGGKEDIDPADITWQIVPISFYGLEKGV